MSGPLIEGLSEPGFRDCLNHGFKGFEEYTGAGYRIG